MDDCINAILDVWFGELDTTGMPVEERNTLWFTKRDETDALLRRRFAPWLERGIAGELDHWADSDHGLVALVVLLDQFSRNIHRGTPRAFAADPKALHLSGQAIAGRRHETLPTIYRAFMYMPLEHCEDLQAQEHCVALFGELARESGHEQIASFERFAIAHRDVIARFGRFPHRNAILGRASTEQELAYLERHGGF